MGLRGPPRSIPVVLNEQQMHTNKLLYTKQALRLTHSPYMTEVARIRCYMMPSTIFLMQGRNTQ